MSIKQIKTVLLGVVALLTFLIFFQACEKSAIGNVKGTFTLVDKETKTVVHEGKTVSITATNFVDSRCPINVDCVWQGNAMVKIIFKDDIKTQEITMCTGGCHLVSVPLPTSIAINGITYKIALEEITPYPTLDKNKPETPKAKITISE